MEAIARCHCGALLDPAVTETVVKQDDAIVVHWTHTCGASGTRKMTPSAWEDYVQRWKAEREANKGRPLHLQAFNPQMVGTLVQGFRLELDVITTVDDILVWHLQALRPWEVEREPRLRSHD